MVFVNYGHCVVLFIEKSTKLNVEDYQYTVNTNDNVVLTKYIGSNTNVVIPTIEVV